MTDGTRLAIVPRPAAELKLWGDPVAGEVNDWIYHLGERLCALVFSIPPGARFTQSEAWKPIYGADELYYVLRGTLLLANPRTGEVVRVPEGSAVSFGRDTWHHGINGGDGELQVLEFFAPASADDTVLTAGDGYGDAQPLERPSYVRRADTPTTIAAVPRDEWLSRMEGESEPILVAVLVSTPALTVGWIELLPGQRSPLRVHGGDLLVYVLDGRLNVLCPDEERPHRWLEAEADAAVCLPAATPYRYFNMSERPVRFLFGATSYIISA
jgi:quercetin dioxygenase-like cupin family protein